jgi:hypothetical protein
MSERDAQKEQLERASEANRHIKAVLEILRHLPEQDALQAVTRLRRAPTIDIAITMITNAALLLPCSLSNTSKMEKFLPLISL